MCGIAGLFDTESRGEVNRAPLQRLNDSERRRGPDVAALQLESGVGLSHRPWYVVDSDTTQRTMFSSVADISLNDDTLMFATRLDATVTHQHVGDSTCYSIAGKLIKHLLACVSYIKGKPLNVLGLTFKENGKDVSNSEVIDLINELKSYGVEGGFTDPQADAEDVMHETDELSRAEAIFAAFGQRKCPTLSGDELGKGMLKGAASSMPRQHLISKRWLMWASASGAFGPAHV